MSSQTHQITRLNQILLQDHLAQNFDAQITGSFGTWLRQLIPEIAASQQQPQNTPWHLDNVWGHILHSLEAMNQLTVTAPTNERLLLAYTMLFHDLGKPSCHQIKTYDGQQYDSFPKHQQASAAIWQRVAPQLKFKPEVVTQITWLIQEHDVFAAPDLLTEKNWQQLLATIPAQCEPVIMLSRLAMVGTADNLAQNLTLSRQTLSRIKAFQQKIKTLDDTRTINTR